MMKIAKSLAMIAFVAAIGVYATSSFFSDTETSTNNTFTAGTIDISVDGENPWTTSWENYLDKPCQVNYMIFEIKNVGENPAKIWKHLYGITTTGGDPVWPENGTPETADGICSSEPEFDAAGGTYNSDGTPDPGSYTERDNIASFIIYDMATCKTDADDTSNNCPLTVDSNIDDDNYKGEPDLSSGLWEVLIPEENQIRVDNVACSWIYLGELQPGETMVVAQSYHLMVWDDANQPMVTNWAQGDTMTFNIELEARQLTAPAPGTESGKGTVILREKNPITWAPIASGAMGTMTYNTSGTEFKYGLSVSGLQNINYSLIYYADPWPGNHPGALLGTFTASGNSISVVDQTATEITFDLPDSADANYPVGAKIWLVPSSVYNATTHSVTNWGNPGSYLFEDSLISFDHLP